MTADVAGHRTADPVRPPAADRVGPAPEATSRARPAPEATSRARPAPEATSRARPAPTWARLVFERAQRFWNEPPDALPGRTEPDGLRRLRGTARLANRHPRGADLLLVVVLAAVTTRHLVHHSGAAAVLEWCLQIALLTPLIVRRRWPVAVFATLSAVALVQWLFADRLIADLALLVALYTVAAHRPRRVTLATAGVVEVGVILASLRWTLTGSWIRSITFLSAMVAAVVLLGTNLQARRTHLSTLIERAERLERERDQQSRIAAAAERARIAREMHDVIAHSLAVMVALADGARAKLDREPDRAAAAIDNVSDLGRQSLRETRRLLGVLRADDPPSPAGPRGHEPGPAGPRGHEPSPAGPRGHEQSPAGGQEHSPMAPQPGVTEVDDLVAQMRATGLDAFLVVEGDPFVVPPGAGLTVYRIVQEAFTNTLKHATGAHQVEVRLRYEAPILGVEVSDDGRSDRPAGVGQGLAGMRERASVYGGAVVAGRRPSGGWNVRATLPLGPGGTR